MIRFFDIKALVVANTCISSGSVVLWLLCFFLPRIGYAQTDSRYEVDSSYIQPLDHLLVGRFYFSRKFTALNFRNGEDDFRVRYTPNTTLNMGVGATYKWATLNLAYGFGFLNPDGGRGETKYLDLQLHNYGRRFTIDMLGQFYRGFYVPRRQLKLPNDAFYIRPDVRVLAMGATVQYIVNNTKFSYRAATLQNEWQKKSAGTPLLGFEVYAGSAIADSTLIPTAMISPAAEAGFASRITFAQLGANGGYAYTLVIRRHFFIMGSATGSLTVAMNRFSEGDATDMRIALTPNTLFRVSAGYTRERWGVTAFFVSNTLYLPKTGERNVVVDAGNYRLNFIYRFSPGKKIRRHLRVVDEIEENVEDQNPVDITE